MVSISWFVHSLRQTRPNLYFMHRNATAVHIDFCRVLQQVEEHRMQELSVDRRHSGTAKRTKSKTSAPHLVPVSTAIANPQAQPLVAALPRTTMAWRAWFPIIGPVMHMFDSAVDALAGMFSLRKGGPAQASTPTARQRSARLSSVTPSAMAAARRRTAINGQPPRRRQHSRRTQ
jgi:hypothetical protein